MSSSATASAGSTSKTSTGPPPLQAMTGVRSIRVGQLCCSPLRLERRFVADGFEGRKAPPAHPGYAATNLQSHTDSSQDTAVTVADAFAQSAQMGALPAGSLPLPNPTAGRFLLFGPDGLFEQRGYPKVVRSAKRSYDHTTAARLWDLSETLTGVTFS